jgi:hypothetical protein
MKANESEKSKGPRELKGTVVQKKFGAGSKSEHDAIYLETDEGDYQLRLVGGNPFSDPELKKLIGKKITATGILNESLFLASSVKKFS